MKHRTDNDDNIPDGSIGNSNDLKSIFLKELIEELTEIEKELESDDFLDLFRKKY